MFEPEEKNINDISLKELTNRSEELGELLSRFADLEEQMGKLKVVQKIKLCQITQILSYFLE